MFNSLIKAAAHQRDLPAAERWFTRVVQGGVPPNTQTFNAVIGAAARVGNLAAAEHWFGVARAADVSLGGVAFGAIIGAAVAQRNVEAAKHWFELALKSGMEPAWLEIGPSTFLKLLADAGRRGDFDLAEFWLSHGLSAGVEPDAASFRAVIDAAAQSGDLAAAERWFEQAANAGIEPRGIAFDALIIAATRSGDAAAVERWYRRAASQGATPPASTFLALAEAAAAGGDSLAARLWFERSAAAGLRPQPSMYAAVVGAYRSRGLVSEAKEWFKETARTDPQWEERSGNLSAQVWLEAVDDSGLPPDVLLYSARVAGHARRGDVANAERWLRAAEADSKLSLAACMPLLEAYARRGDMLGAEGVFARMTSAGLEADERCFEAFIRGYAEEGSLESAAAWADQMERQGIKMSMPAYTLLLKACAKAKPPQAVSAERLLDEMLADGMEPGKDALSHLQEAVGRSRYAKLEARILRRGGTGASRADASSQQAAGTWRWQPRPSAPSQRKRAKSTRSDRSGANLPSLKM